MIISVLIKSLGKDKSDIYIISENYGISNNIKREKPEKKKYCIGKEYLKMEVPNHQRVTQM